MELEPSCCEQSYEPGHPSMRLLPIMSTGQWWQTEVGTWLVEPCLDLTSASGTLSDLPTHDKPTGELQKTEHSGLE